MWWTTCIAKSEAETEMKPVDLMYNSDRRNRQILFMVLPFLRTEVSRFAKSLRGGRAGYGAGSSFLVDFNMLSHNATVFKAL